MPGSSSCQCGLSSPNQTAGCPIFAFFAKVGGDAANVIRPHAATLPPTLRLWGARLQPGHYDPPRCHPEAAESPATPGTPNEEPAPSLPRGSLHSQAPPNMPGSQSCQHVLSSPNQTAGCPIFASFAKVGGDAANVIRPHAATLPPTLRLWEGPGFSRAATFLPAVILRQRSPRQRRGLPTKDLCTITRDQ